MQRLGKTYSALSLAETDKAWFAALWDGEGSFTISKRRPREDFALSISVGNTSFDLIAHARHLLGPAATENRVRMLKSGKPMYYLHVRRLWHTEFLKLILPYVIAKKKQVEVAILFSEAYEQAPFRQFPRERLEELYLEMRALHDRKGRYVK